MKHAINHANPVKQAIFVLALSHDRGARVLAKRIGRRSNSSDFTLVELLCVLAIISILIGMLLPAVQRVRESSRSVGCRNKIRQIVMAAHAFDAAQGRIPPGSLGFDDVIELNLPEPEPSVSWFDSSSPGYWKQAQHTSSLVFLLPFLELNSGGSRMPDVVVASRSLYRDYRESNPGAPEWIGDLPEMQGIMTDPVSVFLCPTDGMEHPGTSAIPIVTSQPAWVWSESSDFLIGEPLYDSLVVPAGTNYVACAGASSGGRQPDPELERYRGYGSCREAISIVDVSDGSSQTIMYGENIGHIIDGKRAAYFPWAFGGLARGRGILPWKQNRLDSLPEFLLLGDPEFSFLVAFGSAHPQTVNVAMGDGSVHGISRFVDIETFYALTGGFDGAIPVDF